MDLVQPPSAVAPLPPNGSAIIMHMIVALLQRQRIETWGEVAAMAADREVSLEQNVGSGPSGCIVRQLQANHGQLQALASLQI